MYHFNPLNYKLESLKNAYFNKTNLLLHLYPSSHKNYLKIPSFIDFRAKLIQILEIFSLYFHYNFIIIRQKYDFVKEG